MTFETTTLRVNHIIKEELDNIRIFLRETYGINPTYNDTLNHLIRFWNQQKSKQGPAQGETAQA